jgi:cytoskeleton protein RodZ
MARKPKQAVKTVELTQTNALPPENAGVYEHEVHLRSRCGGALRTARENQGLSIQEIASRLRLSPKQIEAIEADNFAALPEPTIVRGFIRNYAKQLKINTEPLLDAYNVIVPSVDPHELIVKPSANMKMTNYKKPNTWRNLMLGILMLAGFGVWLFYQNYVQKPSPVVASATEGIENIEGTESAGGAEPLPEVALPAAERAPELQATTELTLPAADASALSSNAVAPPVAGAVIAPAEVSASPTNTVAPPTISPPEPVAAAPAPTGMAKIEFSATQETWVNVIDASGREIYSKTIYAGSRENIEVTPPVNVTVGNAGATSMSFNGKSVELAPHSRNNVAHVKLE